MIEVGVASPSAQGQAITSVEQTQLSAERRSPASSTKQRRQKTPAATRMTTGTNTAAILVGQPRDGGFFRLRCADDGDDLRKHGLLANGCA